MITLDKLKLEVKELQDLLDDNESEVAKLFNDHDYWIVRACIFHTYNVVSPNAKTDAHFFCRQLSWVIY